MHDGERAIGTSLSTRNNESTVMRHLLIDDRGQDLVEYVLLGADRVRQPHGDDRISRNSPRHVFQRKWCARRLGNGGRLWTIVWLSREIRCLGRERRGGLDGRTRGITRHNGHFVRIVGHDEVGSAVAQLVDTCALETRARLTKE